MRSPLFPSALVVVFSFGVAAPSPALDGGTPGQDLWGIRLGSSRSSVAAAARSKFPHAKHFRAKTFSGGLVEDEWDMKKGDTSVTFEALSRGGRVIQLRAWTSDEARGETGLTFAHLLKRYSLKKSVCDFNDPGGGGYEGLYYDDVKRGVCFSQGSQDEFLLTDKPDGILIHRPGVPVVAIENGMRGKRVTGRDARVFADQAEADTADRHDVNGH
jgi:hypothetical protein